MVTLAEHLENRLTVADLPAQVRRRYSVASAAAHMDTASSSGGSGSSVYRLSPMRRRSDMAVSRSYTGDTMSTDIGRGLFQKPQRSLRNSYNNTSSDDCSVVGSDRSSNSSTDSEREVRRKHENQLYQLLAELLQTERNYVKDLEETCRVYLPLAGWEYKLADRRRKNIHRRHSSQDPVTGMGHSQQSSAEDLKYPTQQELRQMLGNIEEVRDYHTRVLLPRLETAVVQGDSAAFRNLFKGEKSKLSSVYGRYCINKTRSSIIVEEYMKYFALFQLKKGLKLRVDAELIKPIQRITRYHMFLSSLAKSATELGFSEEAANFNSALEAILEAANHTNTMMWIGKMEDCPIDLSSQGQLLRQGRVLSRECKIGRKGGFRGKRSSWRVKQTPIVASFILLFQQSVILCRELTLPEENQPDPPLIYCAHVSINQVRVRDVIADDCRTFELQRVEGVRSGSSLGLGGSWEEGGAVARIICDSEQEKNLWVAAINNEVKQLRNMAKSLADSFYKHVL